MLMDIYLDHNALDQRHCVVLPHDCVFSLGVALPEAVSHPLGLVSMNYALPRCCNAKVPDESGKTPL
jgi:hypothetical protein